MEQLRRHYEEEMAANTQKIEEEAKRKAAEELAQASADAEAGDGQEDFDLDAEIEAAQRDDAGPQDAAEGAGCIHLLVREPRAARVAETEAGMEARVLPVVVAEMEEVAKESSPCLWWIRRQVC